MVKCSFSAEFCSSLSQSFTLLYKTLFCSAFEQIWEVLSGTYGRKNRIHFIQLDKYENSSGFGFRVALDNVLKFVCY